MGKLVRWFCMLYIIFIIGVIFGSFYNVVGMRLPNGESIVKPGSHCPKCGHMLSWYENIPLISYIMLGGSCKKCKKPISSTYFLMELLSGALFALCYKVFGINVNFFLSLIIVSLVIIIFVSDSKYMIINDSPLVVASILIFLIKWHDAGIVNALFSILYGLVIFAVAYLLKVFGYLAFKQEALGGGDIKLSFVAGLLLGIDLGIIYIVLASFLAFPYALYVTMKNKDNMLPFGPFLVSSLLIVFLNFNTFKNFLSYLFKF